MSYIEALFAGSSATNFEKLSKPTILTELLFEQCNTQIRRAYKSEFTAWEERLKTERIFPVIMTTTENKIFIQDRVNVSRNVEGD